MSPLSAIPKEIIMSNQATPGDPKHHGKNGSAPKPQDETPHDTASALTITYTPTGDVRQADPAAVYTPLPLDLANLTDEVLAALIEGARAELQQRKARREADFFALVSEQAKLLGVTPARLAAVLAGKAPASRPEGAVDGRSNVRPKFWCLADHALRWSGRGNCPKWMADHLAAGGTEDDCLIPEGAV
jgi:DNA-binding protein H-NS